MGGSAYLTLRSLFKQLPTIEILNKVTQTLPINPGLNPLILRYIKHKAKTLNKIDKVCVLMWDEMAIKPQVSIRAHEKNICGLENWGNNGTSKPADHALSFMIRGLNQGWKVPLSYSFCDKQTKTPQLLWCIKDHVKATTEAGLDIAGKFISKIFS